MADKERPHHLTSQDPVGIDGRSLTLADVVAVARQGRRVVLRPEAQTTIRRAHEAALRIADGSDPVYGMNTGFGALSGKAISNDEVRQLQLNLLRSHAAGAGEPLPVEAVRAIMLARANSLALGYSGCSVELVKTLLELLNAGIHPIIPAQGSVGASGDLAPLAHLGLAIAGIGDVVTADGVVPAAGALAEAGIRPLEPGPKEALALINGTAVITGLAALALSDAERLVESALAIAALSCHALGARHEPFDARLHQVRPHSGHGEVAERMRRLLDEQGGPDRVITRIQDPYSVRCIPQVYGAVLDALRPLRASIEVELNAVNDNPVIFSDGEVVSGGNFHGHPLALPIDAAKAAVASLGTVIERRVALLVDGEEYGLPQFLVANPGLNSGYMIAHYLAASVVAENRILAHPSSTDSIPTSANLEDYNSMGATAARHLRQIVANVETILAVEAICATQACDLRGQIPGGALGAVYRAIREKVPTLERDDRVVARDIDAARRLIHTGALITEARRKEVEP